MKTEIDELGEWLVKDLPGGGKYRECIKSSAFGDADRASAPQSPPTPPLCTHWAVIDSINIGSEKPARVKRTWEGVEYTVDCYTTESVKDQYLAGDIAVGDYVMVEFLEDRADMAVVFAKVYKTW